MALAASFVIEFRSLTIDTSRAAPGALAGSVLAAWQARGPYRALLPAPVDG